MIERIPDWLVSYLTTMLHVLIVLWGIAIVALPVLAWRQALIGEADGWTVLWATIWALFSAPIVYALVLYTGGGL